MGSYDAIIVGSGPNGLAAAVALARRGLSVQVLEQSEEIGGGTRTRELTLPGFRHDVCSAIHPMARVSPFLRHLPLDEHGLEWVFPPLPLAHPLEGEPPVLLRRSLTETAAELGEDKAPYLRLMKPLAEHIQELAPDLLAPFTPLPSHPVRMASFARNALLSARGLADRHFTSRRTRALFAGLAGHSMLPLNRPLSAAAALVLGAAGHAVNWPIARGGSRMITEALASYLSDLGGVIQTGVEVTGAEQVAGGRVVLFDLTPRQILQIAEEQLPSGYARKLRRFRYGPGVFKLDLALSGPIPWRDAACRRAGTVHLGGDFEEIAESEQAMERGQHHKRPYVLLAQQSLFDRERAPGDAQTVWAYCHVPHGSTLDMSDAITGQIERYAPGFQDLIIGRHAMHTGDMQAYNPNYVGGDINGGVQDLRQLFTRPAGLLDPYRIPGTNYLICSSSTPPGGGVHGMCGYHAAQSAIDHFFR